MNRGTLAREPLGSSDGQSRDEADLRRHRDRALVRRAGLAQRRGDQRDPARGHHAVRARRLERSSGQDRVSPERSQGFLARGSGSARRADSRESGGSEAGSGDLPFFLRQHPGSDRREGSQINPTAILIKLETVKHKEVPVAPSSQGTPPDGYKLKQVKMQPRNGQDQGRGVARRQHRGAEDHCRSMFQKCVKPPKKKRPSISLIMASRWRVGLPHGARWSRAGLGEFPDQEHRHSGHVFL